MYDRFLAALNSRLPGAQVVPGKLVRVRMDYPDDRLPNDEHERIERALALLADADDALSILNVLNHLSTMEIREVTPENRRLNAEWNDKFPKLMDALSRRDRETYMKVSALQRGREEPDEP